MFVQRLTNRFATLVILLILAAIVILSPISSMGTGGEEATFCLGFILLFAYYTANLLKQFKLPMISGYIFAGVICGPYIINLLSNDVVDQLQIFDDMALAIIALIAGGEMKLQMIKARKRAFSSVISAQILFAFLASLLMALLAIRSINSLSLEAGTVMAVGLLLGLVMAARSPATTIGIVTETRSKGPFTELIIGITVILDVIILILVAFVIPLSRALSDPGVAFSIGFVMDLMMEVFGSIGVGILFGMIVGSYIRWISTQLPLFLIGVGFFGSVVCRYYHLEPLLAFMVAGFFIENYSLMGETLIKALEKSAFPVYVIFFAISGASINLNALREMWAVALIFVIVRALVFHLGAIAASGFAKEIRPHSKSLWMGFLPQAGVTIGIASVIERKFSWGGDIKTLILAVVAINQLLGPIILKAVLARKGEMGKMYID